MKEFIIRDLNQSDLPTVMQIQQSAYPPALWESTTLFEHKLSLFPIGCLGMIKDRILCAYLFCHPWKFNQHIALNTTTIALPHDADTLYLHDLVVSPSFRNVGIARQMINRCFALTDSLHFKTITLVAVNESTKFWTNFGFKIYKRIQYTDSIEGFIMNCETLREKVRKKN